MIINHSLEGGAITCPIIIILNEPLNLGGIIGENNNIRIFAKKPKGCFPTKAQGMCNQLRIGGQHSRGRSQQMDPKQRFKLPQKASGRKGSRENKKLKR